jgi:hypothetical protein
MTASASRFRPDDEGLTINGRSIAEGRSESRAIALNRKIPFSRLDTDFDGRGRIFVL